MRQAAGAARPVRAGVRRFGGCGGHDPVAGVVSAMVGAHAQIASAAELSIGLRVAGGSRALVRQALWTDRVLVKSRGPRGTVHLLPVADLPMWIGALAALPPPPFEHNRRALLTPEQTALVLAGQVGS